MSRHLRAVPPSLAIVQACVAVAACAVAPRVLAQEESPYYIGARQAFTRDSRVLRQAGGEGDTISSSSLLGGLNLHLGRQRLFADGTASTNRYSHFDQLNNTSHSLSAGLDWQTVERLSGTLRYTNSQNLIDYGAVDVPTTTKDVEKVRQAAAGIRFGITSRFGLDAGAEDRRVSYSAPQDPRGYKQRVAHAGLNFGTPDLLTFGVGARVTKGDYPTALISPFVPGQPDAIPPVPDIPAVYGPDKTNRKDVYLTVTWTPSGLSTLNGRLNATRETHTQPTIPRFSGLTGAVAWDYRPTGRLSLKSSVTRDTGSETLFSTIPAGLLPLRPDSTSINTVVAVEGKYELTGKIVANASLRQNHISSDTQGLSSGNTTNTIGIGADYAATRTISLGCNYMHEARKPAYTVNVASCSAQFILR